jgi:hypothetical protein
MALEGNVVGRVLIIHEVEEPLSAAGNVVIAEDALDAAPFNGGPASLGIVVVPQISLQQSIPA